MSPPGPWRAGDVCVAVLNYNGAQVLPACLDSVRKLDQAPAEVLVVDDGSSDGSPDWVREHHPDVRVVSMGENTKRLNRVRNCALAESRHPLVLLVDNDVELAPDCLEELLAALNRLPDAAVCMPRALYAHDPSRIYQDGQVLHYTAASHALNRNAPAVGTSLEPRVSIGWGVQLIDRGQAAACGNFNECYVMGWGDDGEFNHKLNLAGRLCYHVPTAVVLHARAEGARRYYGTARNRVRFVLESYQLRTLLLCAPALLVYEAALLGFMARERALGEYLRAVREALGELGSIRRVRREIQSRRRRRDVEFMTSGSIFVAPEYLDSRWLAAGLRALNAFLDAYWAGVRRLL